MIHIQETLPAISGEEDALRLDYVSESIRAVNVYPFTWLTDRW